MTRIREFSLAWGYWIMVFMAGNAFGLPMFTAATEDDPTASAGVYAPIIALSVASIILLEAANSDAKGFRRLPTAFIGLGSMASAYMWMADAADTHPADPTLSVPVLILFGMCALSTLFIPLAIMRAKSEIRKRAG